VTGDKGVFSIDTIENAVVFSTTKRGGEWWKVFCLVATEEDGSILK
jgi:hypothetical protein